MSFENPGIEQPKSLLETLKGLHASTLEELQANYKGDKDPMDSYKEGKEMAAEAQTLKLAIQALEQAGGDAKAAKAALQEKLDDEGHPPANPDWYRNAISVLNMPEAN